MTTPPEPLSERAVALAPSPPKPPRRLAPEPKVAVGSIGATVAGVVIWVLQTYVFKGTLDPGLQAYLYAAIPGVLAFAAGWLAPHKQL